MRMDNNYTEGSFLLPFIWSARNIYVYIYIYIYICSLGRVCINYISNGRCNVNVMVWGQDKWLDVTFCNLITK